MMKNISSIFRHKKSDSIYLFNREKNYFKRLDAKKDIPEIKVDVRSKNENVIQNVFINRSFYARKKYLDLFTKVFYIISGKSGEIYFLSDDKKILMQKNIDLNVSYKGVFSIPERSIIKEIYGSKNTDGLTCPIDGLIYIYSQKDIYPIFMYQMNDSDVEDEHNIMQFISKYGSLLNKNGNIRKIKLLGLYENYYIPAINHDTALNKYEYLDINLNQNFITLYKGLKFGSKEPLKIDILKMQASAFADKPAFDVILSINNVDTTIYTVGRVYYE